jgi:DNA-directed RNA polymerase specialized sigma24 family protein
MNHRDGFYEQIIEPIEDRMIRSVWRITRNVQDAEDAMQDALVQIWKRRQRIGSHVSPQALVLKICSAAACDVARRRTRQRRRYEPPKSDEQPADTARPGLPRNPTRCTTSTSTSRRTCPTHCSSRLRRGGFTDLGLSTPETGSYSGIRTETGWN